MFPALVNTENRTVGSKQETLVANLVKVQDTYQPGNVIKHGPK